MKKEDLQPPDLLNNKELNKPIEILKILLSGQSIRLRGHEIFITKSKDHSYKLVTTFVGEIIELSNYTLDNFINNCLEKEDSEIFDKLSNISSNNQKSE